MGAYESIQYQHATVVATDENGNNIYRNPEAPADLMQTVDPDIHSVYQLFMQIQLAYFQRKAKGNFADNRCLGTKSVYTDENGQEQKCYNWLSFDEVYIETQRLAHVILAQNLYSLVEDQDFGVKLKVLGISSVNREEWLITDLAANLLGITTVPLYETLGQQMLQLIMAQTQMEVIFGNCKCLTNIIKGSLSSSGKIQEDNQIQIKKVVCFDGGSQELREMCYDLNIELISYIQLLETEKARYLETKPKDEDYLISHMTADRHDIFTISYTSGTEKNSKGVMITNLNFLSAISNILKVAGEFSFNENDTYLSYLPLAHVFDRLGCYSAISVGAGIGFFGGEILKIIDDLQVLKPTLFVSVPRLLNKVYDRIQQGLEQQYFMKRWLFNKGMSSKLYYLEHTGAVANETYDRLVFNKVKERLGGNVRIMITASAPIADNILNFLKCAFCCPIIEVYGQTESCGSSFCTKPFDNQAGHVGGPAVGIECKLVSVEEMGYNSKSAVYPKGEICLRGPSRFIGYFKNKELTDEVVDQEGWLHTGDVGVIIEGNALKIIDRIKNIFKLSQGEYIVTEKLERVYEQSQFIAQIFIYGDSLKSNIVAIIFPEFTTLKNYCLNQGLGNFDSLTEMIALREVNQLIRDDLQRLANEHSLNSLEQVRQHFRLVDQEFEVGTVLTPTMKIRRQAARDTFQHLISEIYASSDNVVKV